MRLACPHCHAPHPPAGINIQTDPAHCPACDQVAHPSALLPAAIS